MKTQKKSIPYPAIQNRRSPNFNGEFAALEQRQCIVCDKLYETGSLLLDVRLRNIFEGKYACTGLGMCPEHQKYIDDGYIICLEVSNQPKEDGEALKPENANRTGNMCFIKKDFANEIFNMPIGSPVVYFGVGVIEKLKGVFNDAMRQVRAEEAVMPNTQADYESAV